MPVRPPINDYIAQLERSEPPQRSDDHTRDDTHRPATPGHRVGRMSRVNEDRQPGPSYSHISRTFDSDRTSLTDFRGRPRLNNQEARSHTNAEFRRSNGSTLVDNRHQTIGNQHRNSQFLDRYQPSYSQPRHQARTLVYVRRSPQPAELPPKPPVIIKREAGSLPPFPAHLRDEDREPGRGVRQARRISRR